MNASKWFVPVVLLAGGAAACFWGYRTQCALEQSRAELKVCRTELEHLETELAAVRASVVASNRSAGNSSDPSRQRPTEAKPSETAQAGGSVVAYGPEAKLRVGDKMTVSSPTGVMISDSDGKMIGGDLLVETPNGAFEMKDAVVDVSKKKVTAKTFTFVPNQPAQAPNSKPEASGTPQR